MEAITKKRYLEYDLARVLAMIMMPIVHFYESCAYVDLLEPGILEGGAWLAALASFGPVLFMMCLGMNIFLTTHNSAKELFHRAWYILAAAVILNIIRFIIPEFFGGMIIDDPELTYSGIFDSICSDILYFAFLVFLFFALAQKLKWTASTIVAIAMGLQVLNGLLIDIPVEQFTLKSALIGNFIHVNMDGCFSFTQWLIVPALGYALVQILQKVEAEGKLSAFWGKTLIISPLFIVAVALSMDYYGMDPITVASSQRYTYLTDMANLLLLIPLVFFAQAALYFIARAIRSDKVRNFFIIFSKDIMVFYCIQWIVEVYVVSAIRVIVINEDGSFGTIGAGIFYIVGILIIVASCLLTYLVRKIKTNKKQKKAAKKQGE